MKLDGPERTINGKAVQVQPLDAFEGVKMQIKLAKLLGPGLTQAEGGNVMEMNTAKIAGALFSSLDENVTLDIVRKLMVGVYIDGKDMNNAALFNAAFKANYQDLVAVIQFVLEVNFGSLFTMAGSLFGNHGAPAQEPAEDRPNFREG